MRLPFPHEQILARVLEAEANHGSEHVAWIDCEDRPGGKVLATLRAMPLALALCSPAGDMLRAEIEDVAARGGRHVLLTEPESRGDGLLHFGLALDAGAAGVN